MFAKSDMIHAQQKGYQPPEVLKGLCNAVVRNYRGTITKGKEIGERVAFIGGVAANTGAVAALREAFELDADHLIIPAYYAWMGAIGSALTAADEAAGVEMVTIDPARLAQGQAADFQTSRRPLHGPGHPAARPGEALRVPAAEGKIGVYLGIDIGSVSTNLVVLDEAGEVVKEIYVKTDGRPVEVVNKGLAEIWNEMGAAPAASWAWAPPAPAAS